MIQPFPARPIAAGGVDWARVWKSKVETRAAHPIGARNWDARAGRFARMTAELDASDPLFSLLTRLVHPDDAVLDVGAGAGRYTLPLAKMAACVTAFEPSAAMRDALSEAARERGLKNVSVVGGSWPDAEVDTHDVALCAHVVYFVPDIVQFIERLDAAARRACLVYLRVDEGAAPFHPLWESLFHIPYPSEPGLAELYPLLLSLGVRANVEITANSSAARYETIEAAVVQGKQYLGLDPANVEHDQRIEQFLQEHLVRDGDRFILPVAQQSALIWWEKSAAGS